MAGLLLTGRSLAAKRGTKVPAVTARKRGRRNERGAVAVEFALAVSILLLIVFGVVEFARLIHTHDTVRSASREAARYGSATGLAGGVPRYAYCSGIRNAAKRVARMPTLQDADIDVSYESSDGTPIATCPVGGTLNPALVADRTRIVVTVSARFDPVAPIVSELIDGADVSSTTRRSIWP
jgi:Flp pilus assembly protein TadG